MFEGLSFFSYIQFNNKKNLKLKCLTLNKNYSENYGFKFSLKNSLRRWKNISIRINTPKMITKTENKHDFAEKSKKIYSIYRFYFIIKILFIRKKFYFFKGKFKKKNKFSLDFLINQNQVILY